MRLSWFPVLALLLIVPGCFAGEVPNRERVALSAWVAVLEASGRFYSAAIDQRPDDVTTEALAAIAAAIAKATDDAGPPSQDATQRLASKHADVTARLLEREAAARAEMDALLGTNATAEALANVADRLRTQRRLAALAERVVAVARLYDRRAEAYNAARSGWPGRWWAALLFDGPDPAGWLGL